MNFCIKHTYFTREISNVRVLTNNSIMIEFKNVNILAGEHLELTREEIIEILERLLQIKT